MEFACKKCSVGGQQLLIRQLCVQIYKNLCDLTSGLVRHTNVINVIDNQYFEHVTGADALDVSSITAILKHLKQNHPGAAGLTLDLAVQRDDAGWLVTSSYYY